MNAKIDLDADPSKYSFDDYMNEINIFNYRIGHLKAKIRKLEFMRMEVCEHIYVLSQTAGDNSVCIKCGHRIPESMHLEIINK